MWERRYHAPVITLPAWSPDAPDRLVYVSDESGTTQAHTLDLATSAGRRVTDEPVGLIIQELVDPTPTPDGDAIVWFRDPSGDEAGWWMIQPFDGSEPPRELLPDVAKSWSSGIAVGRRVVAAAFGLEDDSFSLRVSRDGGESVELMHIGDEIRVPVAPWGGYSTGGLSRDEALLCVSHAEAGDNRRLDLRVFDVATGEVVADCADGPGADVVSCAWSPIPGDQRLAIASDRSGWYSPELWNPVTGERTRLETGLDGEVVVDDWWPDGSALLLTRLHDGRYTLHRFDLASGATEQIDHPDGCIWGAKVRPDGSVWSCVDSGASSMRIVSTDGSEPIVPPASGEAVTTGHAFRSVHVVSPGGQRVQGFVVEPSEGQRPFPLLMEVHGGPDWFWGDYWSPRIQAFVDAGFAVGLFNYRGSSGFGRAFGDELVGNVGFPEIEDTLAAVDALVADGVADPERVVIGGRSWGGYITLLAAGTRPDVFVAGVGDVPVGDYAASYEDSSPALQAYDRSLLGGSVYEVPELVAERSPITYIDSVKMPLLILYGENDSRCPPRQVEIYIDALKERGGEVEVYKYGTGHASMVVEEEIRQERVELEFLARHVRGIRVPD